MTTIPVEHPAPDEAPTMPDTPVFPPPGEGTPMPPLVDPYEDEGEWQAAKRAYHASYCPCPDCEAEARRKSSLSEHLRESQQW